MLIFCLPNDILGLIFSQLWRVEAKGIPLSCKRFLEILTSKRYFKGWQHFTITVTNTTHHFRQIPSFKLIEKTPNNKKTINETVTYDHFDTFSSVLEKFNLHAKMQYKSLYACDGFRNFFSFQENDSVWWEISVFTFPHCNTLYTSTLPWEELQEQVLCTRYGIP